MGSSGELPTEVVQEEQGGLEFNVNRSIKPKNADLILPPYLAVAMMLSTPYKKRKGCFSFGILPKKFLGSVAGRNAVLAGKNREV